LNVISIYSRAAIGNADIQGSSKRNGEDWLQKINSSNTEIGLLYLSKVICMSYPTAT